MKSSQGNILMTNVSMESEGTYRCEIVGDAPSFEMVREERHMKVYCKYDDISNIAYIINISLYRLCSESTNHSWRQDILYDR